MRNFVTSITAELKDLITKKKTECLRLACDQAILDKVVYQDRLNWLHFASEDLHPPYAKNSAL